MPAPLAAHDDGDKVAFTGSTEVGKLIVQAAAGNLKEVSFELGGSRPMSCMPTPISKPHHRRRQRDLLQPRTVLQRWITPVRQKQIFDDVVGGVADVAKSIKVGPGTESDVQMGPLISDEQFTRVLGYLDSGRVLSAIEFGHGRAALGGDGPG